MKSKSVRTNRSNGGEPPNPSAHEDERGDGKVDHRVRVRQLEAIDGCIRCHLLYKVNVRTL